MDDPLRSEIYRKLDTADLDLNVESYVLGAIENALDEALDGTPVDRVPIPLEADQEPIGAFLKSITVEGFRGIGSRVELPLTAAPGLTVVCGRNGSGKSSFAEAVEVTLTNTTVRWAQLNDSSGWRNLHHDKAQLRVELIEEGKRAPTHLIHEWSDLDDVATGSTWLRRPDGDVPFAELGWQNDIATYRPILSYHELGAMFEKTSTLHDVLSAVLGVDDLNAPIKQLADTRKQYESPGKDVKKSKAEIISALQNVDDPRATPVLAALSKRTPDLDEAEIHLRDDQERSETSIAQLRACIGLSVPSEDVVIEAIDDLSEAEESARLVAGNTKGSAELITVLEAAVEFHAAQHEGNETPCPVCGDGRINDQWRLDAVEQITRLRKENEQLLATKRALAQTRQRLRQVAGHVPEELHGMTKGPSPIDVAPLLAAWKLFTALPTEDDRVGPHLLEHVETLNAAAKPVIAAAREELDRRQAEWRPVADAALVWIMNAREALKSSETAKRLKKAEAWLKDVQAEIRSTRFAPIKDETQRLWDQLRLASNVELRDIKLSGKANRRRVDLEVAVDGEDTSALGVMSQGELHALALAVFLPRATRAESPFRFLLIDDPIQSMDPARVDGLAKVLADAAKKRQVVVFTHDDRLPESLRRLSLGGTVLTVGRGSHSHITVQKESHPVHRALGDARAIILTEAVPQPLKNTLAGTFVREAIETAAFERYYLVALRNGVEHRDVETRWADKRTTLDRLALAMDADNHDGLKRKLHNLDSRWVDALFWSNRSSHGKNNATLDDYQLKSAVKSAEELCKYLTS